MTFYMWFNEHLWLIALGSIGSAALFFSLRNVGKLERRRLFERDEPVLRRVLEQHGAMNAIVLRNSSKPGTPRFGEYTGSIFHVHLILHSPPDRWFVYIHIEGSDPVLRPISEQRAKLALR